MARKRDTVSEETKQQRAVLPPELVKLLVDMYEAGDLQALTARRDKGDYCVIGVEPRPELRGPAGKGRRNTGILIDEQIKDLAMAKAKRERHITGGSLSLLVEWLLWKYLGEPQEFIKQETDAP
ncbi:MAG: hypothetical protein HY914_10170 [Desulfomonile tiedjei]|nr:hypothetical protein [Desulfomonile tiedjei]